MSERQESTRTFHGEPPTSHPAQAGDAPRWSGSPPETNGFAIASLVLGIVWVFWIGSILALIFGYIGKSQIDTAQGTQAGRGLAIAGIVLGWVGIGTLLLLVILSILGVFSMGQFMQDMPRMPMPMPGGQEM